ncbi:MAG: hypothetical protein IPH84_15495 [Bacteroidales bacterium]|nr:hypothetical protein [Bacteroidales bacterium]
MNAEIPQLSNNVKNKPDDAAILLDAFSIIRKRTSRDHNITNIAEELIYLMQLL